MPFAHRISLASLLALALIGCRTASTTATPHPDEPHAARLAAAPTLRGLTLRYLRTEKVATPNEPSHYEDRLELRNDTQWTLVCSSDAAGGLECLQEIRVEDGTWEPTYISVGCGFVGGSDLASLKVQPGEIVRLTEQSWLRPTRAMLTVRRAGDEALFVVSTDAYDSSQAAPGVTPPRLILDDWNMPPTPSR
jgi:hypothetical protein